MWDEITYPVLNFNGATTKFGNGYVFSSHTLLDRWLPTHAGLKLNRIRKGGTEGLW